MRSLALISLLVAIFVSGCDPMATKRVRLQYQNPPIAGSTLTVDSSDTQAALQTLDTVLVRHGFRRLHDYPDQHEHGFIRNYALSFPTAQVAGHPFRTMLEENRRRGVFSQTIDDGNLAIAEGKRAGLEVNPFAGPGEWIKIKFGRFG